MFCSFSKPNPNNRKDEPTANVSFATLDERVREKLLNQEYTREDIRRLHDSLKSHIAQKTRRFIPVCIMLLLMVILIGGSTASHMDFSTVAIVILVCVLAVCTAALWLIWYLSCGLLKKQFNRTLEQGYPHFADDFML